MMHRLLLGFVLLAGLARADAPAVSFVETVPGVRLEVLDWGGSGPEVLLLAGLGHTAHVFEQFAPRLTDHARVRAVTRRGFGASSLAMSGYDTPTLVHDLLAVCDALGVARVVLIGHSVAGVEMTRFAVEHPDRVRGLVYLDAAYDHAQAADLRDLAPGPAPRRPVAADLASPAAMVEWFRREEGYVMPEGELRALYRFAADGRLLDAHVSGTAQGLFIDALETPRFARVTASTLAIFCMPTLGSLHPAHRTYPAADQALARSRARLLRDWCRASIVTFEAQRGDAEVVALDGANHHVFLSEPEGTARRVRTFLLGL